MSACVVTRLPRDRWLELPHAGRVCAPDTSGKTQYKEGKAVLEKARMTREEWTSAAEYVPFPCLPAPCTFTSLSVKLAALYRRVAGRSRLLQSCHSCKLLSMSAMFPLGGAGRRQRRLGHRKLQWLPCSGVLQQRVKKARANQEAALMVSIMLLLSVTPRFTL